MKKNINMYVSFLNFNEEKFSVFSNNKNLIEKTNAEKFDCFEDANTFFGLKNKIGKRDSELIIRYNKNKNVYLKIEKMFLKNEVIIIKNINYVNELLTYLEIIADKYEGEQEWIKYLNENKLGEVWVNGNLSLNIKNNYEEYSKDLGSRKKENVIKYDLNIYEKIWEFEDLFNGKEKFFSGEYYNYWYNTKIKFLSLCM
jgi:hypothetical protein